ncbi:alpha-ketoglutarate-dependent dioxygenase AlkB family protein [Coleofasciculus chthonoplastes]|nr:alpha-ketoglutarate-dependent dioxygenase AlkB [Coleofasciculus chthonoplastes]
MYTQISLFKESEENQPNYRELLPMPDAEVMMYYNFFRKDESEKIFSKLYRTVAWKQETTSLYSRQISLPRLTAWYGDEGRAYTYSKIKMEPQPWIPILKSIKLQIEEISNEVFNSVLLNLYRDGKDSISWHSDDEPELGKNPVIASVSFGGNRRFMFRHKYKKELKFNIELNRGSLLLMKGETQHFWQHQIPKTNKVIQPRINLTFRKII